METYLNESNHESYCLTIKKNYFQIECELMLRAFIILIQTLNRGRLIVPTAF